MPGCEVGRGSVKLSTIGGRQVVKLNEAGLKPSRTGGRETSKIGEGEARGQAARNRRVPSREVEKDVRLF